MADITYSVYIDWDNDGSVLAGSPTSGEDVTTDVLNVRTGQSLSYGRDKARSWSAVKPAQVTIELRNDHKEYMPDNASGPLYGDLGPGKPVLIVGTLSGTDYNIFYGYIDGFEIDPAPEKRSAMLTCLDVLARLAATKVSTACHPSIQTGAAINEVLDAAGWDASLRSIDAGATTLRYWAVGDDTDAWEAIQEIVRSEGGNALAYTDPTTGNFVFTDRHHRLLNSPSITSQATFRDTGTEPLFSEPVEYEVGFRDLINATAYKVGEREPVWAEVWKTESTFSVPAGETMVLHAASEQPFFDAETPEEETDYKVLSGTVSVALSRNSGKSTEIVIFATTAAYIEGMRLRAFSAPVAREFIIASQNADSITKYGLAGPDASSTPPHAGVNDAKAIGDTYVSQRGERLPVFTMSVKNANDTRKTQILTRKLHDRVTIVEAQTSTNHDHFIERIEHQITRAGKLHVARFGCERLKTVTGTQFTFGVAGAGFDQGSFGLSGYDDPATVFILDSSTAGHRLDSGKLAT